MVFLNVLRLLHRNKFIHSLIYLTENKNYERLLSSCGCCCSTVGDGNDVPYSGDLSPTVVDGSIGAGVISGETVEDTCNGSCSTLVNDFRERLFLGFDVAYNDFIGRKK